VRFANFVASWSKSFTHTWTLMRTLHCFPHFPAVSKTPPRRAGCGFAYGVA
jgi:hypothetical protein